MATTAARPGARFSAGHGPAGEKPDQRMDRLVTSERAEPAVCSNLARHAACRPGRPPATPILSARGLGRRAAEAGDAGHDAPGRALGPRPRHRRPAGHPVPDTDRLRHIAWLAGHPGVYVRPGRRVARRSLRAHRARRRHVWTLGPADAGVGRSLVRSVRSAGGGAAPALPTAWDRRRPGPTGRRPSPRTRATTPADGRATSAIDRSHSAVGCAVGRAPRRDDAN